MRGKLQVRKFAHISLRITPADAGKTLCARSRLRGSRDHPRGCGENMLLSWLDREGYGSPPRMRGKPLDVFVEITPYGDHPRGCGENGYFFPHLAIIMGSPPRMRGKRASFSVDFGLPGITPADAGKTSQGLQSYHGCRDHPRGCGENDDGDISRLRDIGSPPRMRGKLFDYQRRGL